MDESCSSAVSSSTTPNLKSIHAGQIEEDDDTLSPELLKMKIQSEVDQDEKVQVKVKSSSSSSSGSTPKRKVPAMKQTSVSNFFQKKVPLAQSATTTTSFGLTSSSSQATVLNNDDVQPLDTTTTTTAGVLRDNLKSKQRQSRKSGVVRNFDSTVDQNKRTSQMKIQQFTKRIKEAEKDYIKCTVNDCTSKFVYKIKTGYGLFYRHYREVHGTLADTSYPCYYADCGLRYTSRERWESHNKTHSKDRPFACDHEGCDKRLKLKTDLTIHKTRVHSPELRRFVCTVCRKRFYKLWDLRNHCDVHSKDKKISCLICGNRFSSTATLLCHLRLHIHPEKQKCELCGLLSSSRNMKRHLGVHERNNNFFCSTCSMAFDSRNDIIDHYVTLDHIEKEKARLAELDIPRCVPIESREEYHETMYFEPSDPGDPHYLPCDRWKNNRKCKNCYCTGDYKAVYFKDKKWKMEGQVSCGQTMGVYVWDMVEMTDDELHPMDKFLLKHDDNPYFDDKVKNGDCFYHDDDEEEEEEANLNEEEKAILKEEMLEEEILKNENDEKKSKIHYNYGGQYQSGFRNRTYSHFRGSDGKRAREFFLNPKLKKKCAALYGQADDKKDPALVNLVERFVIDDFNLTCRCTGGINSSWGIIAMLKYRSALEHTFSAVPQ